MKVLIIYNKIWSYRERIFDLLNQEFDLTVSYCDPTFLDKTYKFKTLYLPVKKIGPFEYHIDNLHKIASAYDVVIGLSNIRWLSVVSLILRKRTYKLGYWGIGVRASYKNKFDSKNFWDRIRYFVARNSDFMIFYSSYPLERYIKYGIPPEKLFVAHNTVEVSYNPDNNRNIKKNLLFIGTLYKQKGLDELLRAYHIVYRKNPDIPNLLLIGDGPERTQIEGFVQSTGMKDNVIILGSIYHPDKISEIFEKCMACISPNQAGLSVLTAMGNKTIFITKEGATTGGEIFNIEHQFNGIIYKNDESLANILEWIIENPKRVEYMNENALSYYQKNRTPEMMADAIKTAISHSLNKA